MKSAKREKVAQQRSNRPLPLVFESCELLGTEATAGIEPAMKVLQTSALPLGYVA
jgi:hypothetical protein